MALLNSLWYSLFPIRKYVRDTHYQVLDNTDYILAIKVIKGKYKGSVGFDILSYEDGKIVLKSKFIDGNWDFTNDKKWCIIGSEIFFEEYRNALENYRRIKQEVLNDDADDGLGTDYSEESFPQRTVYKKGSTVPKRRVFSRQKRKATLSGNERLHSKVQPPANHGSDTDIFDK